MKEVKKIKIMMMKIPTILKIVRMMNMERKAMDLKIKLIMKMRKKNPRKR